MTDNQKSILHGLTNEIVAALNSCEHYRWEQGGDPDKIETHIKSYEKRVLTLRAIRERLENEFTIIHYDPR